MGLWRKKTKSLPPRGVARAAAAGAPRAEIIREALACLADAGEADRLGVWITPASAEKGGARGVFYGTVRDEELGAVPPEWSHLAAEFPLPRDLLLRGRSVMQQVEGTAKSPLLGPLAGLREVLWVPVNGSGRLQGILLAGSRSSRRDLPQAAMEGVAAELSLMLGAEQARETLAQQHADLCLGRRNWKELLERKSPEALLESLAENCTASERANGPGAVFAAIGRWKACRETVQGPVDEVEFLWSAGEAAWKSAVEREPLARVWREALISGQTTGSERQAPWSQTEVLRAVAIPLKRGEERLGVLFSGLEVSSASLVSLERLEYRALLAASALAELRDCEERLERDAERQTLLEASRDALIALDRQGRILWKNRAAKEELEGQDVREEGGCIWPWIRARERAACEAWFRKVWGPQGANSIEPFDVELQDGRRSLLHAECSPDGAYAILRMDRAQPPERNSGSQESAELLALVEWLDQGVILFDAHERVRALNLKFAQLAELAPDEADNIGTLEGLIERMESSAADPEEFASRWRDLAKNEAGAREEVQLAKPAVRILERVSRPVWDANRKKLGRIEIYRDLTAQRIFQARLLQTEKLAALGQMVSAVAHELSNPLTSIAGYAQRLLLRKDTLGRSEEVHRIFSEAQRAGGILRQMLLSAREAPVERRPIALNQVVQRTVEVQRLSMAAEKIHVELDLDPLLPPVHGDAGQLQQVLMNLMGNARQAIETQGQGGTIRLRTGRTGTNRVRLEVSDTGPGIPKEVEARIFDPFFTTKGEGIGTGLGLSIVLGIVREHGGQVYVNSQAKRGATFVIELPAATAEARAGNGCAASGPRSIPRRAAAAGPAKVTLRRTSAIPSRRVMIVEDEPTVAQLIADVLQDGGFHVEVVTEGRRAPERAAASEFDMVICDVRMPGLDGPHFYRSLALAGNPLKDRFLFVTGDALAAQTKEFLEKNGLPYVAKPFRVEELMEKVERVLSESKHVATAPAQRRNAATKG